MSISKIFYNTDNAELLKSSQKLVSLVETSGQVKEASSSAISKDLIEENKPDDDHFALHVIALGDYERFGPNRNQDAFTKDACRNYHKTFLDHGHYFVEHNNQDPRKAIGQVKASAYNEPMGRVELIIWGDKNKAEHVYENIKQGNTPTVSMACFAADTLVYTFNGFKEIQNITYDDFVLTHTGSYQRVYAKMCKEAEEIVTISLSDHGNTKIKTTPDHQFFTLPFGSDSDNPVLKPAKDIEPEKDRLIVPFIEDELDNITDDEAFSLYEVNGIVPSGLWGAEIEIILQFCEKLIVETSSNNSTTLQLNSFENAFLVQNLLESKGIKALIQEENQVVIDKNNKFFTISNSDNLNKIIQNGVDHIPQTTNFYCVPMDDLKIQRTNCTVYDISVENDETYNVYGMAVHNCKVAYDVSSITGKKQKTRNEYDEYCKHRLGQFIPEHNKYAFVYNPEPKFFDISDVAKPADRIAYTLDVRLSDEDMNKTASLQKLSAADRAFALNLKLPETSSGIKGCVDLDKRKTLMKLAECETFVKKVLHDKVDVSEKNNDIYYIKYAAINSFDQEQQLQQSQLDKLSELRPGTLFNLMSKKAIFLPFDTFAAYVTNSSIKEVKNNDITKYALIKEVPCVFNSMLSKDVENIENIFDASDDLEIISDSANTDEVQRIMNEASEKFSVDTEPMKNRIIEITITKKANQLIQPEQTDLQQLENKLDENKKFYAKKLATAYGLYKIATINHLNKINKSLDDFSLYSIISQNLTH